VLEGRTGLTFRAFDPSHSHSCHHCLCNAGLRLEGQTADATLELQRLEVWDPAAKIVVQPGGGAPATVQGPPDVRYFKGSLAGVPGSTAMLAVDAAGGVSGMATHGRERWALGPPALSPVAAAAGVAPAGLSSRRAAAPSSGEAAPRRQRCSASNLKPERPKQAQQAQQAQQARGLDGAARNLLASVSCCSCWEGCTACTEFPHTTQGVLHQ